MSNFFNITVVKFLFFLLDLEVFSKFTDSLLQSFSPVFLFKKLLVDLVPVDFIGVLESLELSFALLVHLLKLCLVAFEFA
jgi:hypothetical protein